MECFNQYSYEKRFNSSLEKVAKSKMGINSKIMVIGKIIADYKAQV
jgi:hypothetical protein